MVCFYTEENAANTVYKNAWVADVPTQEIIDSFKDWEPDLQYMLPVRILSLIRLYLLIP